MLLNTPHLLSAVQQKPSIISLLCTSFGHMRPIRGITRVVAWYCAALSHTYPK